MSKREAAQPVAGEHLCLCLPDRRGDFATHGKGKRVIFEQAVSNEDTGRDTTFPNWVPFHCKVFNVIE